MIKKEIFNFYFPVLKNHKSIFLFMIIISAMSGIMAIALPVLLKLETDQLAFKNSFEFFNYTFSPFEIFIIILGLILLVNLFEKFIYEIIGIFLDSKIKFLDDELLLKLFYKMKEMEVGILSSDRFEYILKSSGIDSFLKKIINFPGNFVNYFIQIIGLSIVYTYFNWKLLLVVILSVIAEYVIERFSFLLSSKLDVKEDYLLGRQLTGYSNLLRSSFSNIMIAGGMGGILKKYKKMLDEINNLTIKAKITELIIGIYRLLNQNLRDIILKLIVGYGVFAGTNSIGMVALVISSLKPIEKIFLTILNLNLNYKEFRAEQEIILLLFKITKSSGNIVFNEKINNIKFNKVTFSYPNLSIYEKEYLEILERKTYSKIFQNKYFYDDIKKIINQSLIQEYPIILSKIDIEFEKGKIYGIVGKNGAGKTTLMNLLSGFYKSYEGKIFFNGKESIDFTTNSFLHKVSFLSQIPYLLEEYNTIKENLLLGVEREFNDEEIWNYLELFGLAKKIKKSKKLLDSEIGNDIEFSGGERQLIAFIRLLLQDRDIIIMDEGTNQLDAENEILVMNELLKHKEDKIIIFITHRMSTISKADVIYTLESGKISHVGTHKELLSEGNNAYAKFYKHQVLHE